MGKRRQLNTSSKKNKPHHGQQTSKNAKPTGITKPPPSKKKHTQPSQSRPIIPFSKDESILLIGEADLSFSRCLIDIHACTNLVSTVLEASEVELVGKYPAAEENIRRIRDALGEESVKFGVDVQKKGCVKRVVGGRRFERVFFNFPHVGGKSTDVNRQVRYNQELLVAFFTSTTPLLSPTPGSSILVTLFEGEPYSLWNIRDLGRHCGLEVKRSWGWQKEVWRGYGHCRTLGVVRGKDGKEGKGWRGEERKARCFEFVRRGEGVVQGVGKGGREGEESSDEDEDVKLDVSQDVDEDLDGDVEEETNGESNDSSQDDSNTAEESWEGIDSDNTPDESNEYEDID